MIQQQKDKLLNIFNLGLRSENQDLKIEIINYIATETMIEALHLLVNYTKEEETPALQNYIDKVIKHLGKPLVVSKRTTIPYPREEEDTGNLSERDELLLRWNSSFKELPKDKIKEQ